MRKKRKKYTKADAQRAHAIRRAKERYGLDLTEELYRSLSKQIHGGHGQFLGRQSNIRTVWRISAPCINEFGEPDTVSCTVVYDKVRHQIVTFLPVGIVDAKGVTITPSQEEDGGDSL